MSPPYFTNISASGPVRCGQLPGSIGILEALDKPMPIGTASAIGRTDGGMAVWGLRVHGADVPGRWVIVDRKFAVAKITLRYSMRTWMVLVAYALDGLNQLGFRRHLQAVTMAASARENGLVIDCGRSIGRPSWIVVTPAVPSTRRMLLSWRNRPHPALSTHRAAWLPPHAGELAAMISRSFPD